MDGQQEAECRPIEQATQKRFQFELLPKLTAIAKLRAPLGIRKLLNALATIGCANPALVVLGEGGEDGEWLLAPSRQQVASAVAGSVTAFKRWRKLAESSGSPFVSIDRVDDATHNFLINWPAVFAAADEEWTPVHFGPESEMDPGPFSDRTPVHSGPRSEMDPVRNGPPPPVQIGPRSISSFNGIGERIALLKPTKENPNQEKTNQPTKAAWKEKTPARLGITIGPYDLRHPSGLWKIVDAATRAGILRRNDPDAVDCLAFLLWVNDQPVAGKQAILDKGAFVAAALTRKSRAEWGFRAGPANYAAARKLVAEKKAAGGRPT